MGKNQIDQLWKIAKEKLFEHSEKDKQGHLYSDIERLFHQLQVHQSELEKQSLELRSSTNHIENLKSKYEALFNFAPVGFVTLNRKGIIFSANVYLEKLLKAEQSQVVGTFFHNFLNPADAETFFNFLNSVFESTAKQACQVKLGIKKDKEIIVMLESQVFYDKDLQENLSITSITDVTQRINASQALLKAQLALEKKVKRRTEELEVANIALKKEIEGSTGAKGKVSEKKNLLNKADIGKDGSMKLEDQASFFHPKIAEIIRLNEKLLSSEEELKTLNANKDKFLYILAHDLKSPFNSLLFSAQILAKQYDSLAENQIRTFIKNINTLAQNFQVILDDLLSWSAFQHGNMRFKPTHFNIHEKLKNMLSLLQLNANEKGIELRCDIENEVMVHGDTAMVNSILQNLISNAIKFTKPGGVVSITCKELIEFVEFNIKDNGVGMNAETVKNLFTLNNFGSKKGTANEKGTGLGLLLSKEFVEKHQGLIWAESKENQGTTFCFTLPKFPPKI